MLDWHINCTGVTGDQNNTIDWRRRSVRTAIITILLFAISISLAHCDVLVTSTFDNDDEGWRIVGDAQQGSSKPSWSAENGNPGGHIYAKDDVLGGVFYWLAPEKFLGDKSGAYGYTLDFDLKQSIANTQFDSDDIIITGGGITIKYDTSYNPGTDWTHYSVLLATDAGWMRDSSAATYEDITTVLSSISSIQIRAEYRTGADTDYLDNVVLYGAVPEPGSIFGVASGLGIALASFIRRRK